MNMKKLIIALVVGIILIGIGVYALKSGLFTNDVVVNTGDTTPNTTVVVAPTPVVPPPPAAQTNKAETVIGTSVEERAITAYHYGSEAKVGTKELLFLGGAHGGYEWNTVLVAYELMDYLKANPKSIPAGVRVTVIPVLNPDGLFKVVGTAGRFAPADVPSPIAKTVVGRYNAHNVDLNRNFDCDWQSMGMWQNTTVSGGSSAFSEPESKALEAYVALHKPDAAVVWFSAAGGVFSSRCHDEMLLETSAITKVYADASGYPAFKDFDFYAITGDMVNWLAKNKIPAISVLLSTHSDTEWSKNQAGVEALLKYYSK
jgi:hypothetical protein